MDTENEAQDYIDLAKSFNEYYAEEEKRRQREREKLIAEGKRLATLTPAQRVAEILHQKLCNHNHIDACCWHYDEWPNNRGPYSARQVYLEMAERVLAVADQNEQLAINFIKALKKY